MVSKKTSSKKKVIKNKEVEKKVEKVQADEIEVKDEEPRWYHYTIVSLIFILFFAGAYFALNHFEDKVSGPKTKLVLYDYYFEEGGREGKIQFYTPVDEIEDLDFIIAVSKFDLLNSEEIYFSFFEYNGTDNGEVVRTSGRLVPFLRKVYRYNVDIDKHIVKAANFSCLNSTPNIRVIEFNPYSDKNGVFYDSSTGCIEFLTDDPKKMGPLGDKFFYTLINE